MPLFCLLYPSATLARLYDPVACLNEGMYLAESHGLNHEENKHEIIHRHILLRAVS